MTWWEMLEKWNYVRGMDFICLWQMINESWREGFWKRPVSESSAKMQSEYDERSIKRIVVILLLACK